NQAFGIDSQPWLALGCQDVLMVKVSMQQNAFSHGSAQFGKECFCFFEQGSGERAVSAYVMLPQPEKTTPPVANRGEWMTWRNRSPQLPHDVGGMSSSLIVIFHITERCAWFQALQQQHLVVQIIV